jgi:hypothetical protein
VPLRIYPGGIKTRVAWHEVPGKKKKDAFSPVGTGLLFSYRGRDKGALCPSLRTGLADFPHPALQLVVNFQEDRRAAAYACFKENKPTAEKKLFCHRY